MTSDGVYILMHDATLDRTTDAEERFSDRAEKEGPNKGKILAASLTLDEVKSLTLTDGADGGEHRVTTLREALALGQGRVPLDLDLKEIDVDRLAPLVEEFGADNLMAFNSDPMVLKAVTDRTGVIPLPINVPVTEGGDPLADFDRYKAMWGEDFLIMHTRMMDISPALVARAETEGVRLWVNTLNDPDAAAERFNYTLWNAYIESGATVLQSDLSIELTRFLAIRANCAATERLARGSACAVFELD